MSNEGELLITDKEEVIVNFKIPSRNKHDRSDRNLVDSSAEIRNGYSSVHPRKAYHKKWYLCEIWMFISQTVVNEGSSLLVLE